MSWRGNSNCFVLKELSSPTEESKLAFKSKHKPVDPEHDHEHGNSHDHEEEHDHGFHADKVISKDEEGYMVAHGNHAHYFYKKDLSPQEIAAAEATP